MSKVELYEQIRRGQAVEGKSIRALARQFGVHRRTVREALRSAVPAPRKKPVRERPRLGPVQAFIDQILVADKQAPPKQRHTAKRISDRIERELQWAVSESSVRNYVRQRKPALGWATLEVYVPQVYAPGTVGEADWYEAYVLWGEDRQKVHVFSLRACYSAHAFHMAFERATQQAFLQAHEEAFHYFGGVFAEIKYDNLSAAVKQILRGHSREETERFVAFRSHWGFVSNFCNPGRGNEKGGVEGEVGRFRRHHFVPLPVVESFAQLNAYLLAACDQDRARCRSGQTETVGEQFAQEQKKLLPLCAPFGLEEYSDHEVDRKSRVVVRTNRYSVPVALVGRSVQARVSAQQVKLYYAGQCVAKHERSYGRYQDRLQLDHYLEVLQRKPGALAGSLALAQMRAEGHWPESYDRMWSGLKSRYGNSDGTRQMVELLLLAREKGAAALQAGIEDALAWGCFDAGAVQLMITRREEGRTAPSPLDVGALAIYDRPGPDVRQYDQLLRDGKEVMIQ